jgi:hypothetical protein
MVIAAVSSVGLGWSLLWAFYAIGPGTPTPSPNPSEAVGVPASVLGVIIGLVLTCVPGLLYVFGVRTWIGSVVAWLGFAVVFIGIVSLISQDHSSTAGAGILGVPVLAIVPIGFVIVAELNLGSRSPGTSSATRATRRPSAGWYEDPSGEHPWRWWDGQQWTSHVR